MYTVLINFVRPLSPASLYVDEIQAILNNLFGQLSKKKKILITMAGFRQLSRN